MFLGLGIIWGYHGERCFFVQGALSDNGEYGQLLPGRTVLKERLFGSTEEQRDAAA